MYACLTQGATIVYRDAEENCTAAIPASAFAGLLEAANPPALQDEGAYLYAMQNPVDGCPRLREIAKKKQARTAAVIVSDITRNVPTVKVARHIVNELLEAGVPRQGITFFVALGVHRPSTPEEMTAYIGEDLYRDVAVVNHTPFDKSNLVHLGTSRRGTPVWVNKAAYECDLAITVGKVELHEMAGFSGGRKSILPGICAEETIAVNHSPEMMFDKGTGAGRLVGNPIHEDMLEVAQMFNVDFSVNFVVDSVQAPAAVFAGSLEKSHQAAVEYLRRYCELKLNEKADIYVITPGYPLSCDLYQGVKALVAMQHVIGEDTVVVLYGNFPEGVNSEDFLAPLKKFQNLDEAYAYAWNNYKIQMDHTLPVINILKSGVKIIVCSRNISRKDIETLHMLPCDNLQDALDQACTLTGKEQPRIAFCPRPQRAIITDPR